MAASLRAVWVGPWAPRAFAVTSHYQCFRECETKEITPKGTAAETSNLLNKWKYVTHTNNSLTLSI